MKFKIVGIAVLAGVGAMIGIIPLGVVIIIVTGIVPLVYGFGPIGFVTGLVVTEKVARHLSKDLDG